MVTAHVWKETDLEGDVAAHRHSFNSTSHALFDLSEIRSPPTNTLQQSNYACLSMSLPPQLSCEHCQRAKKSCDKTIPCSTCLKVGIACKPVRRRRLPRGRTGNHRAADHKEQILSEKVERLEAIVAEIQQKGSSQQSTV